MLNDSACYGELVRWRSSRRGCFANEGFEYGVLKSNSINQSVRGTRAREGGRLRGRGIVTIMFLFHVSV